MKVLLFIIVSVCISSAVGGFWGIVIFVSLLFIVSDIETPEEKAKKLRKERLAKSSCPYTDIHSSSTTYGCQDPKDYEKWYED